MSLAVMPLLQQFVVLLAALALFLSFVLLAQTRLVAASMSSPGRGRWWRR